MSLCPGLIASGLGKFAQLSKLQHTRKPGLSAILLQDKRECIDTETMKATTFHELLMLNILDVVEHKLKHEDDVYKCLTRKQLGKLLNKTKDKDKFGADLYLLNTLLGEELGEEAIVDQVDELVERCLGYNINYGAMALVACILLHSMAMKADEKALRGSLNSYASDFDKQAIEVLNRCYKR
ncbi:hypothetical protein LSAT2_025657 [Lamellibrachia satsuma]|nr:hypothetical protein LSAT2_025657 [Lamellibrachia satsuma]